MLARMGRWPGGQKHQEMDSASPSGAMLDCCRGCIDLGSQPCGGFVQSRPLIPNRDAQNSLGSGAGRGLAEGACGTDVRASPNRTKCSARCSATRLFGLLALTSDALLGFFRKSLGVWESTV